MPREHWPKRPEEVLPGGGVVGGRGAERAGGRRKGVGLHGLCSLEVGIDEAADSGVVEGRELAWHVGWEDLPVEQRMANLEAPFCVSVVLKELMRRRDICGKAASRSDVHGRI